MHEIGLKLLFSNTLPLFSILYSVPEENREPGFGNGRGGA